MAKKLSRLHCSKGVRIARSNRAVKGKDAANRTHREVGAKVRQTIKELGGTMPEDLPTVESIKKIETKQRKQLGKPDKPAKRKDE